MAIVNNGICQWKFQRAANIFNIIAGVVLICALFCHSVSSYEELAILVGQMWVKIFFAIALLVAALNSVLAGWQIGGDYAHKIKLPVTVFVAVAGVVSLVYLVYGLRLLL